MSYTGAVKAIVVNDTRRMLRDQFLLGASTYIIAIAVALRWVAPWLQSELLQSDFDIAPYLPLGMSYFLLVNASVLTGMLGGFLLLETREERAVKALLVSPTPLWVHLGTLGAGILAAGIGLVLMEAAVIGVGVPAWTAAIAASVIAAPTGLVMALILATFASNKVEAFAVMKMTSFLGLIPIGAYFLPEPWQFIAGVAPPFWACKLWWMACDGDAGWVWMIGPGLAVSALWVALLLRRFQVAALRD